MQFLCQIGKFLRLKSRKCGIISSTQSVCMMAVLVSTTETPAMLTRLLVKQMSRADTPTLLLINHTSTSGGLWQA